MASSTFDPNTGQWSDGGPIGMDGGNPASTMQTPAQGTYDYLNSISGSGGTPTTPASGAGVNLPPPVKVGEPAPPNVDPTWWASLQKAMANTQQQTNYNPATATTPTTPTSSSQYPTDLAGWQNFDPSKANDQASIQAYAQWLAQQPGADPLIASQVDYLAQRIAQTGGLTAGNVGYWQTRTLAGNWTAPENAAPATGQSGLYGGLTQPQDTSGNQDAINAALLKLLQTPTQIDPTTVAEAPEAVAERLQSQRSAEQQIAASAEQEAQSGESGTGGAQGLTRQILSQQGVQDATFQGQLASTLRQQQIQQLEYGLQLAINSGQFDKAQQLEAQIAQLNAGLSSDQLQYQYDALNSNVVEKLLNPPTV